MAPPPAPPPVPTPLVCGLNQPRFTAPSSSYVGNVADLSKLKIQAKTDAWTQIRQNVSQMLGEDCPGNCDYLINTMPVTGNGWKNAQAPFVTVYYLDWSITTAGQQATVQVTFNYMVTYICGNA